MRRFFTKVLARQRALRLAGAFAASMSLSEAGRADLVGLYTFDDGSATDSSGFGNHGTIVGSPTPEFFGGAVDGLPYMNFPGAGSYINTPVNGNPTSQPKFTMGAWAKIPAANGLIQQIIAHDDGGWDRSLGLDSRGNGLGAGDTNYRWTGFTGNGPLGGTTPVAGTENQWVFVAAVYDENQMRIHVNGNSYSTTSVHGASGAALRIGGNPCCGENWIGGIDNVFFFNEALQLDQIESIRAGGVPAIQALAADPGVLVNKWDFETGDLNGFTSVAGTAFANQPTFGDNPRARNAPVLAGIFGSNVQGNWFVGTYENRPSEASPVGGNQSDAPTGILQSDTFVLAPGAQFELSVGGGFHAWNPAWDPDNMPAPDGAGATTVNLERQVGPNDWEMIFSEAGRGDEIMHFIRWDASAYAGETVRLRVYDNNTGGWGHINVDNIQYFAAIPEPSSVMLVGIGALAFAGYAARRRKTMAAE